MRVLFTTAGHRTSAPAAAVSTGDGAARAHGRLRPRPRFRPRGTASRLRRIPGRAGLADRGAGAGISGDPGDPARRATPGSGRMSCRCDSTRRGRADIGVALSRARAIDGLRDARRCAQQHPPDLRRPSAPQCAQCWRTRSTGRTRSACGSRRRPCPALSTASACWSDWQTRTHPTALESGSQFGSHSVAGSVSVTSCSRRPPPQLVLRAQAHDVDLIQ
jgi:hypothetical protein